MIYYRSSLEDENRGVATPARCSFSATASIFASRACTCSSVAFATVSRCRYGVGELLRVGREARDLDEPPEGLLQLARDAVELLRQRRLARARSHRPRRQSCATIGVRTPSKPWVEGGGGDAARRGDRVDRFSGRSSAVRATARAASAHRGEFSREVQFSSSDLKFEPTTQCALVSRPRAHSRPWRAPPPTPPTTAAKSRRSRRSCRSPTKPRFAGRATRAMAWGADSISRRPRRLAGARVEARPRVKRDGLDIMVYGWLKPVDRGWRPKPAIDKLAAARRRRVQRIAILRWSRTRSCSSPRR